MAFTREWRNLGFKNSERGAGESAVNRPTSHFPLQSMTANGASIPERLEWKPFLCHQNLQYMAHFHWHSLLFPGNTFCGVLIEIWLSPYGFFPVLMFLQLGLQALYNPQSSLLSGLCFTDIRVGDSEQTFWIHLVRKANILTKLSCNFKNVHLIPSISSCLINIMNFTYNERALEELQVGQLSLGRSSLLLCSDLLKQL